LLVSVLLRPVLDSARLHRCTGVVALAAVAACARVAGVTVWLKWPNDLVVGDGKLAGVLAESDPSAPGGPPGSTAVVVGIGLNVGWPGPPGAGGVALSPLAGRDIDRDELLDALLEDLGTRLTALDAFDVVAGPDADALLEELRARCVTIGRSVRVVGSDRTLEGIAVDLDDHGHLVVRVGTTDHVVAAADVVHLRPGGTHEANR
jgi:BirA family biotin operon repressor/biotin-[acetyl-CoA-carboxylase] ligase